ncbi:MAG: Holliday junction resolvase RuvX [Clostridiales bacterium]|jgi:putative Holliday junction resolvase|nr:Holliday junction resolvase RuvX [Clostridiales bacterium]
MRILCLDYGDKFTGIAVSDDSESIAVPLVVIMSHEIKKLIKIIVDYKVKRIVIGMPKKLNGANNKQCEKVCKFKKKLENKIKKISIDNSRFTDIVFWDERFSTIGAKNNIMSLRLNLQKEKKVIDKHAATFILQGYLDFKNFN